MPKMIVKNAPVINPWYGMKHWDIDSPSWTKYFMLSNKQFMYVLVLMPKSNLQLGKMNSKFTLPSSSFFSIYLLFESLICIFEFSFAFTQTFSFRFSFICKDWLLIWNNFGLGRDSSLNSLDQTRIIVIFYLLH